MPAQPVPTPAEIRARLDALGSQRGFVLEHHGALAASAPDLHDAYHAMYAALTLTDRHLSAWEREFIWLALLLALREPVGTHHLDLFRRAGGTQEQAETAFRVVGYAAAAEGFAFARRHWSAFFPALDARTAYGDGLRALCGPAVPYPTVLLAMAAVQTGLRSEAGIEAHIIAAYDAGVGEDKLAEALSLTIWPTGVNRFVDACRIWHRLMGTGAVTPSPRYRAWADTPGLGAFQPA